MSNYPLGAEHDSRAPYNQPMSIHEKYHAQAYKELSEEVDKKTDDFADAIFNNIEEVMSLLDDANFNRIKNWYIDQFLEAKCLELSDEDFDNSPDDCSYDDED